MIYLIIAVLVFAVLVWAGRGGLDRVGPPRVGVDEARAILGVGPNATEAEIREAHSRLMRVAHPDKGGTSGLAAQLNAARDRLLKR